MVVCCLHAHYHVGLATRARVMSATRCMGAMLLSHCGGHAMTVMSHSLSLMSCHIVTFMSHGLSLRSCHISHHDCHVTWPVIEVMSHFTS